MTTTANSQDVSSIADGQKEADWGATPRRNSAFRDIYLVGARAIRLALRDPEAVIPNLVIGIFFFLVNIGAFQRLMTDQFSVDVKAYQMPVAILFTITGVSRAARVVVDIEGGYFDRLLMTPIRRVTLLLGLMVADFLIVVGLTVAVLVLGLAMGVRFESGLSGMLVFILLAASWGIAYSGIPYSIALKTGNPAAVNGGFLLFFPFAFLTTSLVPTSLMTGWMAVATTYNPVTYLLNGLRSLILDGWDGTALLKAFASVVLVGAVTLALALAALRGRASSR
ncbi:MAG: ABC transporter permease [Propionibacteriales bacterium]|nr:ABC transporter permease [Propionibacteriales bacterium]